MIDFHCHLDLYERPYQVVRESRTRECYVLAVTTTPLAWEGTRRLLGDAPRIRLGVGLHPELVKERHSEVKRLCELVPYTRYVGEIGLDGSPTHRASMPDQLRVLARTLAACEDAGGRILSLHSRGAVKSLLDHLESHPKAGLPILHWFSGTQDELRRAIDAGAWFSVGPAMLQSEHGRKLAALMPRERLLTETDGPFGRGDTGPLMPWDVVNAVEKLAGLWGISPIETQAVIESNLRSLGHQAHLMQVR